MTKGEAQARVTEVNAEAIAKQTTLEGNAEAGITFTKGEAEAKALALRADAYRQFNEAAIISTVLAALPEIVRAAAEPMASIGSLTVLSTDGASDVVKNATRTVTEASATVKGLTGIDIPQLSATRSAPRRAPRPRSRRSRSAGRSGGGGVGRRLRRLAVRRAAAPAAPAARPARRPGAEHRRRERVGIRIVERAGHDDSRRDRVRAGAPRRPDADPRGALRAGRGHHGVGRRARQRPAGRRPRRPVVPAAAAAARVRRPALGPASRGAGRGRCRRPGRVSTLSDSAVKLAEELQRVPGIERFGGTRLRDLERSGPRTLRTLWGAARDDLETRYGDVTIGMLLDEYERSSGGGAPGPSH